MKKQKNRTVNMLAVRAKVEAGWILAYAPFVSVGIFVFPIPEHQ